MKKKRIDKEELIKIIDETFDKTNPKESIVFIYSDGVDVARYIGGGAVNIINSFYTVSKSDKNFNKLILNYAEVVKKIN